ncbi:hypothetical protein MKW92_048242 [Papaver armeniacum]|nr:hypothetical protein MKW92_048242 [Papaver armeniacum]
MAIIKTKSVATHTSNHGDGGGKKREMTIDEFKSWIMEFDSNGDGRISKDELHGDGYIDDDEIYNLLDFAEQCMGIKIIAY